MKRKRDLLPVDLTRIALSFYEGLGSPFADAQAERLRKGDWKGLAESTVDPRSYSDATVYYRDACAASLLRKLPDLPHDVDRREAAITKWWDGERQCFKTNRRLARFESETYLRFNPDGTLTSDGRIANFIDDVKKQIASWIGHAPPSLVRGKFGPGGTFSDRRPLDTIPDKITNSPAMTRSALWYLPQFLSTLWGQAVSRRNGKISFVRGNRFSTAPKTSLTDRSIACEPSVNVFYQLAMGRSLRERLESATRLADSVARKSGWNLDTAADRHGQVARKSSSTKEFATLDLSNASDTVAWILVKILLPQRWFEELDALRSAKTLLNGHWVHLEKFSSMGNGFTFELETIIFAAISCVASRNAGHVGELGRDVFVFGDDIIVKDNVVADLKPCLEFFGFSLNMTKSFWGDVPFRESCGLDYFKGKPVRPFFLKEMPNEPQDFIAFANGLASVAERFALHGVDLSRRAWFRVLDCIPTWVRNCRGPKDLGDLVIHDQDTSKYQIRERQQKRHIRVYRPHRFASVGWEHFKSDVILACATYGEGTSHGGVIPRDSVTSYKVGWVSWS